MKRKFDVLRVGRFRRSVIYRPLAIALAILLVPSFSWFASTAGIHLDASAQAFQASAQIVTGSCNPSQPNAIIQTVCPGGQFYARDLYQFESDSVNAYLGLHNLPPTDSHLIYDDGRADLRNAIRGTMLSTLLGVFAKPASARTAHEQALYTWLQTLVQQNEIAEYTSAINEYGRWRNDPCDFTLDPAIAAQYGLSYDGFPFCDPYNQLFGGPPVPATSYFLAYGLKNSYGKPAQTTPNFGALVAGTGLGLGEVMGIGLSAGAVVSAGAAAALAISAEAALAVFDTFGVSTASSTASASAFFAISGAAVDELGIGFVSAGPVAIILLAVAIGVAAGFQAFSNEQAVQDLNNLSNTLTQVTNTPPDLNVFATDSTGLGMLKLTETLTAQMLPDTPSTAVLPAHRAGTDPSFSIAPSGGSAAAGTTLTYQDWSAINWSAETYGGWFVQTCNSGASCTQADSIMASIHYVDWAGTHWTASRFGSNFVSTKGAPASTDQPCPANATTGLSPGPDFSACSSYVSSSIPLKDGSGNQVTVSLSQSPVFSSPATFNFTAGRSATASITASGIPLPSIALSSSLPSGFTFQPGNGTGTASLAYASAPDGTYQVTLAASNGNGSASQTVTINVITPLTITSPSTLSATAALPVNFLVTTTGSPVPSLSIAPGLLPAGLTFKDNGNGTATISGTVATSIFALLCLSNNQAPCEITASNSQSTVTQVFSVDINPPPSPTLVSSSATFVAGIPNSVRVTSTGAITPVSYSFSGQLFAAPSWLSFHDNGDGSGVLSGTPPEGTAGLYTFMLLPFAAGNTFNFISANFTLNVNGTPIFTSPSIATFTVGTADSFAINTNGASVSADGFTFPRGLTFQSGAPASITGTPAPGTGGVQTVPLTAVNSTGSVSQTLTINIYEAPHIPSANSATFLTGMPGSFAVTTTGYPSLSTQPVSQNPTAPTSPTQGQGMYFTVTGLPSDLQYSNLNPQGLATGTLTIQGTPSAADAGLHQVQITAQNGVGVMAEQTLALNIIAITGAAPASGSKCNGNYTGTFKGAVTVSAGQNCTFISGGITGNVTQNGGNLALANATVTGNVVIQGPAAFSLGQNTKINGNLTIQNVASGASMNQICGAKLLGNVQVFGNATPLQLGSTSPDSCPGNFVGGGLAIQSNTAAMAVYNSDVAKNLSCGSNTSITGGGNAAQRKLGQCATF